MITIHVLFQGVPIGEGCSVSGIPAEWPAGNAWVRLSEVEHVLDADRRFKMRSTMCEACEAGRGCEACDASGPGIDSGHAPIDRAQHAMLVIQRFTCNGKQLRLGHSGRPFRPPLGLAERDRLEAMRAILIMVALAACNTGSNPPASDAAPLNPPQEQRDSSCHFTDPTTSAYQFTPDGLTCFEDVEHRGGLDTFWYCCK